MSAFFINFIVILQQNILFFMLSLKAIDYQINFNKNAYAELNDYIKKSNYSNIFILGDANTLHFCLPLLKKNLEYNKLFKILEIGIGENYKTIDTCTMLWQKLCNLGADRHSLLINLGGGIVTDLGGFVAATLKRGIHFINIPTTLLGMVDAAIGGKTGINLGALKNQVGVFCNPKMIIIDTKFLITLPHREFRSGMAEIIKYGLSYDKALFDLVINYNPKDIALLEKLIHRSVEIKNEVVLKDPTEQDLRKVLNFGHSLGHAVESHFLKQSDEESVTHGEAVATGMIAALYISHKYYDFNRTKVDEIKAFILNYYGKIDLNESDFTSILDLLKHDKKAKRGIVKFILIDKIGSYKLNCEVNNTDLIEALKYYIS